MAGLQLLQKQRGIGTATGGFDADVNAEMKRIISFLSLLASLIVSAENVLHIRAGSQSQTLLVNKSMGGMLSRRQVLTSSVHIYSGVGACGAAMYR
jgi:hypothetical protein